VYPVVRMSSYRVSRICPCIAYDPSVGYVQCVMSVECSDPGDVVDSRSSALVNIEVIYYLLTTRLTGLDQYRNTSYSVDEPTARIHGYSL
jgi:hypothetical protein